MVAPDLDMPSNETVRWSPHRKASVVNDDRRGAIRTGSSSSIWTHAAFRLTTDRSTLPTKIIASSSNSLHRGPTLSTIFLTEWRASARRPKRPVPNLPRHSRALRQSPAVVLLVDDDDFMREITTDILIGLGYEVLQAANGDAALKELNNGGIIDILLTDLVMNGMNGRELAHQARALHPMIPILFISGCADLTDAADQHQYQLIKKPFRPGDLRAHIEAALRQPGTPVGRPDIPE